MFVFWFLKTLNAVVIWNFTAFFLWSERTASFDFSETRSRRSV